MSYMALARKWRPRTFSQMLGQEPINKALTNALMQQRLHHAYLFTGTRGVGKTSVARVFAKALNCEQGISDQPCLSCDTCVAIEQGRFLDLIEIDGASKTRVEDTRELLENVHYAPASGRYKIYLIDEVHMLSQHSFNALLKTLEEPPEHVKFMLATTDPQKVPVTVLSRCLQFNLKPITTPVISQHLEHILKQEALDFEPKAISLLAQAARGSMRDALSLLDQAITSCDQCLRVQDVNLLLGYTKQDYALFLLHALAQQDASLLLELNQQIAAEGEHYFYVMDELIHHLHEITVFQAIGDANPLISPSDEIKTLATQFSPEDVQLFYQIALKGREDLHLAPTLSIGFSMTLLRMLTFRPAPKTKVAIAKPNPAPVKEQPPVVAKTINNQVQEKVQNQDWATILSKLQLTGVAMTAMENTEFVVKEERTIRLRVAKSHQSLFSPATLTRIEKALSDYYQENVKIAFESAEQIQTSPAQQKSQALQKKQLNAENALENDPLFRQIKQDFTAELVKNSIVPLKDDL